MLLSRITQTLHRYQNNLKRSSAIQQGLLNISIFLISLFLLSIITFFFVTNALSERLDTSLQQRMDVLLERVSDDDWEEDDDHESPYEKLGKAMQDEVIFLTFPQQELKLRRNRAFQKTGYSNHYFGHDERDDDGDRLYRMLVEYKEGRVFVVAENNENDHEILAIVMSAFVLNGLIALILTALLVIYLANRSHRQIRQIEHVLHHAAQGDLKQRVGSSGKNNDLAHVSVQIDTMLSRLETSMAAMTDISANIAHELKTPISRLRHDLITALDQHEQGQDAETALNDAYEESGHITETFDALLRIAQIEGGARRANFKELDLRTVTGTVMDIYAEVAEDAGMSLTLAAPLAEQTDKPTTTAPLVEQTDKPLTIQGDKELLIQMLANLVENSIRYCPEGTAIEIDCSANGTIVQLSVADNGAGIPLAEHEHVFQRLYRLDKSRSDKRGTGLGLSLVKAIVELHDAEIELEDNEPGLRVMMQFPA